MVMKRTGDSTVLEVKTAVVASPKEETKDPTDEAKKEESQDILDCPAQLT